MKLSCHCGGYCYYLFTSQILESEEIKVKAQDHASVIDRVHPDSFLPDRFSLLLLTHSTTPRPVHILSVALRVLILEETEETWVQLMDLVLGQFGLEKPHRCTEGPLLYCGGTWRCTCWELLLGVSKLHCGLIPDPWHRKERHKTGWHLTHEDKQKMQNIEQRNRSLKDWRD